MDDFRLFAGVVALAAWAAVWIIAPSIGDALGSRKQPPNFKAGAVDASSTETGGA